MAVPVVTCDAQVILEYDASPQTVNLGASATNGPIVAWVWTMLSVPDGSAANVGANGDFTDGVASVQNPTFDVDGAVDGTYVLQCVASNAEGDSDPAVDRAAGQQLVSVRTMHRRLILPNDYAYNWGKSLLIPAVRDFERLQGGVSSRNMWDIPYQVFYVDPVAGNDANDGSSWAQAKASFDHVWAECIPEHVHTKYGVIWRGTIDDSGPLGGWYSEKVLHDNGMVLIAGEPGVSVVSGPLTVTSGSTWYLDITGAGWTPDEHKGKWLRFDTQWAPAYQFIRGVIKNTADRLYFNAALPGSIAGGSQVSFVEPLSTYSGYAGFSVGSAGWPVGLWFQHFNLDGWIDSYGGVETTFVNILGNLANSSLWAEGIPHLEAMRIKTDLKDPLTGGGGVWNLERGGCMMEYIGAEHVRLVTAEGFLSLYMSLDNVFESSLGSSFNFKSRITSAGRGYALKLSDCGSVGLLLSNLELDGGGTGVQGLLIGRSHNIRLDSGFVANNFTAEAVSAYLSTVVLRNDMGFGVPTGSSNGTGLKARHSRILVKAGAVPTLTGTTEVAHGTGSSTWAAINGGTPLVDANELTSVITSDMTGY